VISIVQKLCQWFKTDIFSEFDFNTRRLLFSPDWNGILFLSSMHFGLRDRIKKDRMEGRKRVYKKSKAIRSLKIKKKSRCYSGL